MADIPQTPAEDDGAEVAPGSVAWQSTGQKFSLQRCSVSSPWKWSLSTLCCTLGTTNYHRGLGQGWGGGWRRKGLSESAEKRVSSPLHCSHVSEQCKTKHPHQAKAEALILCARETLGPLAQQLSWREAAAAVKATHGRWRYAFFLLPGDLSLRLPTYLALLLTFLGRDILH